MKRDYNVKHDIEPYLVINDIMHIFRCKRDKALEIINIKGFPKMRLGRTWLFERSAVRDWMHQNRYSDFANF